MLSLKNIMRLNATSCLVFGSLFTLFPGQVATFLGGYLHAPQLLILIIGVVLIVNAIHLIWALKIPIPKKELILYFSAGDFLWVIASLSLVFSGHWITTTQGIFAAIVVTIIVGFFGVMQIVTRKAMGYC